MGERPEAGRHCIEDLGDVQVLLTDKTGTLTEGRLTFMRAVDASGSPSDETLRLGMLCNAAPPDSAGQPYAGADPLDAALWASPAASRLHQTAPRPGRVATLPFDHDRRMVSVVLESPAGRQLVTKGAPRRSWTGASTYRPLPNER